MEGNAYDSKAVFAFRAKNRTNDLFRSKILSVILTTVEESRATTSSLIVSLSRQGTREIISPRDAHTLAMVKRKKMRGLIVVARADRIYRSSLEEGLRSAGRGKLPFAPTCQASVCRCRTNYSDRMRFSPFLEIARRNVHHPRVPYFTKLSSVVRNAKFRESVDLPCNRAQASRYFSCGAVAC